MESPITKVITPDTTHSTPLHPNKENNEKVLVDLSSKTSSDLSNPTILTAVSNNNNNNTKQMNANIVHKHQHQNQNQHKHVDMTANKDTLFTLKKWNLVSMWSWDVECEVCAICRTALMDSCLKCQTDNKHDDCVVVWGDCNHSFHNCCMSQWIKSRNLCPLCQSEWHVQRVGR
jgi:RING-box protein 2